VRRALLIDLDETLVVEEPAAVAAFAATARVAAPGRDLDAERLAVAARVRARELWRAAPTYPYCHRIGISSWEGLWCGFEGDEPAVRELRSWAPVYRREAWRRALAEQGVDDPELATELGERFGAERRARHEVFADVPAALEALRETHALALVTNGASCLQREKLAASGLEGSFDAVVVSGEVGTGKPDVRIFRHALALLGADAAGAAMVGDSLARDVDGAVAAGIRPVWVNRFGRPRPGDRPELREIATLDELPGALEGAA
jgi:putative hydrolase of the HAD superfamily